MTDIENCVVGRLDEIDDPGCREFAIGDGDWPLRGFVVRQGDEVYAYQNICKHAGHPLNWKPHSFLTKDKSKIICSSHGAIFEIASGECTAGPCVGKFLNEIEVRVDDGNVIVRGPNSLR